MISVLLTLLKIIGIVLLSLLGILFVLLLIVLFVPVRYRIKGYYKDEFICHGKITWLLHLLSVSIDFDKELVTSIRVFGIDISSFLDKKKNAINAPQNKVPDSATKEQSHAIESTAAPESLDKDSDKQPNEENADSPKDDISSEFVQETGAKEKQSLFQRINNFFLNIKNKLLSVYHKVIDIIQNIKTKKETVSRYLQILQKEEVKNTFSLCKKRFFKMLKHLLPKKMKIHAHIGMEDPSTTGYILAIYSVLPDKLRKQIVLKADFDEVIMEADYNIKGSCNAFNLLFQLLCILTNKNCWTFYKLVKKEISNERK